MLPDRIFRPGPALRFVAPEAIASQLARSFDPHLPALLFVDDLPYHFTGEGLPPDPADRRAGTRARPCT